MKTQAINFMNDIELFSAIKPKPKVSYYNIQPYFIAGFVAYRGYGKTYSAIKLILELIKENALKSQDIFIISPTFENDTIFQNLGEIEKKNILTDLNQSNEFMARIKSDIDFRLKTLRTVRETYTKREYSEWYKNIIDKIDQDDEDEEDFKNNYNLSDIEYLHLKLNDCEPEPYFYDYIPHYLIFVDDAFNSQIYSDAKNNLFKNFVIKHRHYMTSIIMCVQSFTGGIPKQLRKNVSHWFIWKQSENEIKEIFKEVLSDVIENQEEFIKLFKEITNENKHNFIFIDKEPHDQKLKLRKNFNEIIIINPNEYNNVRRIGQVQRNYKKINYKRNK